MVEIPRLEAKLNLRNGRLILYISFSRIEAKPTMSIWTRSTEIVIPVKTGIQKTEEDNWIPASAGMTGRRKREWVKSTSSRQHLEPPSPSRRGWFSSYVLIALRMPRIECQQG